MLCAADPRHGKYLCCSVMYRGAEISTHEVDKEIAGMVEKNSTFFVEW